MRRAAHQMVSRIFQPIRLCLRNTKTNAKKSTHCTTKTGIRKIYKLPKRKFVKPCVGKLIFEKI